MSLTPSSGGFSRQKLHRTYNDVSSSWAMTMAQCSESPLFDIHLRTMSPPYSKTSATRETTRTIDGNGLVTDLKDGNGNVTGFDHDTLDRLVLTTLPDGSTRATEYNEASDVKIYTHELGTTFTNGLDAMGRVTGVTLGGTSTPGTTSQGFQFDGLSRPTQAVDTGDI
jgi:YD repeat-containing protein